MEFDIMKTINRTITVILILFLVCVAGCASAAATETERVVNGDFTNDLTGWNAGASTASSILQATGGACYMDAVVSVPETGGMYSGIAEITQQIDLTDVQQLTWKSRQGSKNSQNNYVLNIYDGNTLVADYTWSDLGTTSYNQHSYNVASLSGVHTVKFRVYAYGDSGNHVSLYLTGISAKAINEPGLITSCELNLDGVYQHDNFVYNIRQNTGITLVYTAQDSIPAGCYLVYDYGDGSVRFNTLSGSFTYRYSREGVYQGILSLYDSNGVFQQNMALPSVTVVSAEISAYPVSIDVGGETQYSIAYTGPETVSGYAWTLTSGTPPSTSLQSPIVRYNTAGTYGASVVLTTASGMQFVVSASNVVSVATQGVSFTSTRVESGDAVTVTWSLRDTAYPYTLNIYPSASNGERTSYETVTSHTISSASDTSFTYNSGVAGYYTAYIEKNGVVIARSQVPVSIISLVTLTVNVMDNGAPYLTDAATVKLYKSDNTLISTKQTSTSSNSVEFTGIETGNYYVTIEASGQTTRTSPPIVLTDSYFLNIDFTFGSSEASSAGVGSQYATTFVTFRCQDSGTGKYLQNVQIIAEAVQPTNAWEYFANLFGSALGSVVQSMTLSGVSDMDGRITFAMYQNVKYSLNITYQAGAFRFQETRPFQQSALSGEYLIDIPVTDNNPEIAIDNIHCTVTTEGENIRVNFSDDSGTVSVVKITVYEKVGDARQETNMTAVIYPSIGGGESTQLFSPQDAGGKSYIVSFEVTSSMFGVKRYEFGVTFPGVAIKLGNIPNGWYIWISFGILLMLGGVATVVNSRHFAVVICVVATLLFFAGWLNQLGPIAPVALIICYVLAIVYYIANRNPGGV